MGSSIDPSRVCSHACIEIYRVSCNVKGLQYCLWGLNMAWDELKCVWILIQIQVCKYTRNLSTVLCQAFPTLQLHPYKRCVHVRPMCWPQIIGPTQMTASGWAWTRIHTHQSSSLAKIRPHKQYSSPLHCSTLCTLLYRHGYKL